MGCSHSSVDACKPAENRKESRAPAALSQIVKHSHSPASCMMVAGIDGSASARPPEDSKRDAIENGISSGAQAVGTDRDMGASSRMQPNVAPAQSMLGRKEAGRGSTRQTEGTFPSQKVLLTHRFMTGPEVTGSKTFSTIAAALPDARAPTGISTRLHRSASRVHAEASNCGVERQVPFLFSQSKIKELRSKMSSRKLNRRVQGQIQAPNKAETAEPLSKEARLQHMRHTPIVAGASPSPNILSSLRSNGNNDLPTRPARNKFAHRSASCTAGELQTDCPSRQVASMKLTASVNPEKENEKTSVYGGQFTGQKVFSNHLISSNVQISQQKIEYSQEANRKLANRIMVMSERH